MPQAQQQLYSGVMPAGGAYPMSSTVAIPAVIQQYAQNTGTQTPHIQQAYSGDGTQIAQQQIAAEQASDDRSGVVDAGLAVGQFVASPTNPVGSINPVGGAIYSGIEAVTAGRDADTGMNAMVESYRYEVAAKMGVNPANVNEEMLRQFGENDPTLKEAIDTYDEGRYKKPLAAVASAVAGGAAMVATGGLAAIPASIAASWAAGKTASGVLGETEISETAHGKAQAMKQKLAAGEYINAKDVFDVYITMDKNLAAQVEQSTGKEWADLDEEAQAKFMNNKAPKMLAVTSQEAYLINSGSLSPEMVLFTPPEEIERSMMVQTPVQPRMEVVQSNIAAVGDLPYAPNVQAANDEQYRQNNNRKMSHVARIHAERGVVEQEAQVV